jgi:hypothetical protein
MRFSLVIGLAAALLTPALASAYDDPKSLVVAIYQPYQAGRQHADLNQFYSTRLKALFLAHAETAAAGVDTTTTEPLTVSPAIDFNPFIDAQHALILDVAIGEPVVVGEQALVTVGFHNFDQPTLLSLSLVKEPDGWKVDDVTSMGGEENWMLSWLLQFDPWGM